MKTSSLLLLVTGLLFISETKAQSKLYKYCRLTVAETKHDGSNEIIHIDFGNKESLDNSQDTEMISISEKVKTFTDIIDALDYLNSMGWEYMNTVSPVRIYFHDFSYMYILRKDFAIKDQK